MKFLKMVTQQKEDKNKNQYRPQNQNNRNREREGNHNINRSLACGGYKVGIGIELMDLA
jgi:hypothetical protein